MELKTLNGWWEMSMCVNIPYQKVCIKTQAAFIVLNGERDGIDQMVISQLGAMI